MTVVTQEIIADGLTRMGLPPGSIVLVHSSLSSFGHVEGGANTVIDALLKVVGENGTIVVPTLTGDERNSPENPPVFDPVNTSCWTGRIPETFRQCPAAIRSVHPTHSVAAIGPAADELTAEHILSISPCDELSPYGKIARRANGYILFLGVDHEVNTTFHHVEELVGVDYHMQGEFAKATLIMGDERIERHYMLHRWDTARNFNIMDSILLERGIQRITRIGNAEIRLIAARRMVQVTAQCLKANPRFLVERDIP
jgi:aminoglycoside 3-N-acetyltransferase